jgi:hypothetical protein
MDCAVLNCAKERDMTVEFKGPNPKFTDMKKDKGDVKVGSGRDVKLESVNHDDFAGKSRLADKNPGTGDQSRDVHGTNPFEKGKLTGMEQPKMGLQDEKINGDKKLNEPPRAFKYSREGHAIENGSKMEGQGR